MWIFTLSNMLIILFGRHDTSINFEKGSIVVKDAQTTEVQVEKYINTVCILLETEIMICALMTQIV